MADRELINEGEEMADRNTFAGSVDRKDSRHGTPPRHDGKASAFRDIAKQL